MQPTWHQRKKSKPAQACKKGNQQNQGKQKRPEPLEANRQKAFQVKAAQSSTFAGKQAEKRIALADRQVFAVFFLLCHLDFLMRVTPMDCS